MIIKAGTFCDGISPFAGNDIEWFYDNEKRVEGYSGDYMIFSIDPEDFLAIADAIRGVQKRFLEDEK